MLCSRFFIQCAVACSLFAAVLPGARAISFTVDPMTTELTLAPGAEQTNIVRVQNDLPAGANPANEPPLRLRAYIMDWTLDRNGAPQFLKPDARPDSCAAWIQVNPTEVVVPAGGSVDVRCTIRVPSDARGTYHAILMFESAPSPMAGRQGLTIGGRIGDTIYVQVGPQARRARITGLKVEPKRAFLTVENTGTCQVRLSGKLKFTDSAGQVALETPIPGAVLLPGDGGVRDISVDLPDLPSPGDYSVTALLDYGGDVLIGARTHVTRP